MEFDNLYDAAIAGDADARAKLEMEADKVNTDDETILHVESKNGNAERVGFILREFGSKNLLTKLTKYKHTALHWAIYRGHTEVAEVLIDAARHLPPSLRRGPNLVSSFQAFLRQGDFGMDTALHAAVMEGNAAIVKLLVEADPTDAHIQNQEGKTPMYIAVENGFNNIVDIISKTCTAPSLDGPHGRIAMRIKNPDQAKSPGGSLYKIGDQLDVLYDAAITGDADAIAELERKANRVYKNEYTILHTESKNGNTERVRFILREFASKNLLAKLTKYKHTALHKAIYNGHTEVAEVLIDAARRHLSVTSFQAFLRQGDYGMDTALHAAVMEGNVAIVKLLVEVDPTDRHIQNDEGKTPMYIAVEKGFNDIVEIISKTCTAPSLDGPDCSTAVRIKNVDQVKSPGGPLYKIMDRDALYAAAIAGDADAFAKLEKEADNTTILHTESKKGNAEHVRFILREFANKNLLVKLGNQKETALHLAACLGHTEVAEVLIEAARQYLPPPSSPGDNPITSFQAFLRHADHDEMNTALHEAVMKGHLEIVKLLVEAGPGDRHIQNKKGETPIYIAAEKGYTDIVKVICTTCTAPLNFDGPGGRTALHAAVQNRNHDAEVVEILIAAARLLPYSSDNNNYDANGYRVSPFQAFLTRRDEEWNTALHIAVMQGNLATAKLLVEADPTDPGIENNKGKIPLLTAVESGYADIAKMICTTSTCPFPFKWSRPSETVLHAVIKNLDEAKKEVRDVIKMIIDRVKDGVIESVSDWWKNSKVVLADIGHTFVAHRILSQTDESGCTILELAVERNYVEVVELILDAFQDYWTGDAFIGLMPLIYKAMDKDYKSMVNLLTQKYEAGAQKSVRLRNQANLISAIRIGETETCHSLLDEHAKDLVTFADSLGWTALHHAAYNQFDSILNRILDEQKKFQHKFVYENMISTPFHVAAEKGYDRTVILLIQLWPSCSSAYTAVDKNGLNILHLAAMQSKREMIQGILKYCPEEYKRHLVNQQNNDGNTPLHLLIQGGCFVPEIIRYEGFDFRVENKKKWTPTDMLYFEDHIIKDQVKIKLVLDHVQIDQKRGVFSSSVVSISEQKKKDVDFKERAQLMIDGKHARMKQDTRAVANCFADAIAGDPICRAALEMEADTVNEMGETMLHVESKKGATENVRFIVREFANRNLLVKLDNKKQTALHLAAQHGHNQVVEALIDAARHLPSSSSANNDTHNPLSSFHAFIRQTDGRMGNTALHIAVLSGNVATVKLLIEADPHDSHVQNNQGKTPIYIAAEKGYKDKVKEICTTCTAMSLDGRGGRTTALHALIQNIGQVSEGVSDVIRMMVNAAKCWSSADFEALFSRTDELGNTVLQLAVEKNNVDAVRLLLIEDPAYQQSCQIKRNGLMLLIFKAIDRKYSDDIIKLLSQTYEVGISPDHKDVVALILAMKRRDEDSVLDLLGKAKHLVSFTEDNGWTPLHYAVYHDFDLVLGAIIQAQEEVGHQFVYGNMESPFHVAVKYGYTSTLLRLMQLWPAPSSVCTTANSPYTVLNDDGQNILHLAAAGNRKEMVQGILKYCPEEYKDNILKQQDINGDTPLHLLISHGCHIPELIKHKGLDTMARNNNNFTPRDMLYSKNEIVADQVHIKIALDDVQTNQSAWNFWARSTEKKEDMWKSVVPPSKRRIKDVLFDESKKLLMDEMQEKRKKDLERYKMRTNTQTIVTALITTVTFTVGFTMPGGLHQSGEVDEGLVLLSKKKAFRAFMVSNALALLLSTSSLFFYFLESMSEDPHQVSKLNAASTVLNIVSVVAMMLTFITGTYVMLSHSPALAITVCVIGSLFFLLIIIFLIKIVYDRHVRRNKD